MDNNSSDIKRKPEEEPAEKSGKKALITEKITGRRMTAGRLFKYAFIAALCGAVFGIAAAAAFNNAYRLRDLLTETGIIPGDRAEEAEGTYQEPEEAAEDTDDAEPETGKKRKENNKSGSEDMAEGTGESSGTSDEEPGGETGGLSDYGSADNTVQGEGYGIPGAQDETGEGSADTGEEDDYTDADAKADTKAEADDSSELSGETGSGEEYGYEAWSHGYGDNIPGAASMEDTALNTFTQSVIRFREQAVEKAGKYLVNVNAISTGTTWFDNEVSSTETYAGIIIDVGEDEILILTSSYAAVAESLKAVFSNGVTVDAYVKQVSYTDGLAVLAVSSVNGMEESMLDSMEAVAMADRSALSLGELVLAAGAPLGTTGSYSFGEIGYIDEDDTDYDVAQSVFYADIEADAEKGTFVLDYNGTLLGIVLSRQGDPGLSGGVRVVSSTSLINTVDMLKQGTSIAYTGIMGTEVSFDMRYNGVPEGIYVTGLAQDGPAYDAGIMRGDIICGVDDEPVSNMEEYTAELRKHVPGESIEISVKRLSSSGNYIEKAFTVVTDTR